MQLFKEIKKKAVVGGVRQQLFVHQE